MKYQPQLIPVIAGLAPGQVFCSSSALKSQGMTIGYGDAASPEGFTSLAEVTGIAGPGGQAAEIPTTDLSSSAVEIRMGLPDEGSVTLNVMFLPANTGHALMRTWRNAQTEHNFQMAFTDSPATLWTFGAFVIGLEINNEVDGVTTGTITLRVTGAITET